MFQYSAKSAVAIAIYVAKCLLIFLPQQTKAFLSINVVRPRAGIRYIERDIEPRTDS